MKTPAHVGPHPVQTRAVAARSESHRFRSKARTTAELKTRHGKRFPLHFCLFCTEQAPALTFLLIPASRGKIRCLSCLRPRQLRAVRLKTTSYLLSGD